MKISECLVSLFISIIILFFLFPSHLQSSEIKGINLYGTVIDSINNPVKMATVSLLQAHISTVTDSLGRFILTGDFSFVPTHKQIDLIRINLFGKLIRILTSQPLSAIDLYDLKGRKYGTTLKQAKASSVFSYFVSTPALLSKGIYILRLHIGASTKENNIFLFNFSNTQSVVAPLKQNAAEISCVDTIEVKYPQFPIKEVPIVKYNDTLKIRIGDTSNHVSIAFIGNSLVCQGIDLERVKKELYADSVERMTGSGAATPYYYAVLHKIAQRLKPPKYVFVVCYEWMISDPHFWLEPDRLQDVFTAAGNDTALLDTINNVLARTTDCQTYDFYPCANEGFLPLMIREAKQAGIQIIFALYRAKHFAANPFLEGESSKAHRKLSALYCDSLSARFLDYTSNPDITINDYFDFEHYNHYGQAIWTGQIISDIKAFEEGRRSQNEGGRIPDTAKPTEILSPLKDTIVQTGTKIALRGAGSGPLIWSYVDPNHNYGEVKIGEGSSLDFLVPTSINNNSTIYLFLWGMTGKIATQFHTIADTTLNRPPDVYLGIDTTVYIWDSLVLNPSVTDDSRSGQPLSFTWEVVQGPIIINNLHIRNPIAKFTATGPSMLRLTVSDGEYAALADRLISITADRTITISSPCSTTVCNAGDQLHIIWNSSGIPNVIIAYSFDGGRSWSDPVASMAPNDSRWGDFIWTTPADSTSHSCTRIKISDYDMTVQAITGCFKIIGSTK